MRRSPVYPNASAPIRARPISASFSLASNRRFATWTSSAILLPFNAYRQRAGSDEVFARRKAALGASHGEGGRTEAAVVGDRSGDVTARARPTRRSCRLVFGLVLAHIPDEPDDLLGHEPADRAAGVDADDDSALAVE